MLQGSRCLVVVLSVSSLSIFRVSYSIFTLPPISVRSRSQSMSILRSAMVFNWNLERQFKGHICIGVQTLSCYHHSSFWVTYLLILKNISILGLNAAKLVFFPWTDKNFCYFLLNSILPPSVNWQAGVTVISLISGKAYYWRCMALKVPPGTWMNAFLLSNKAIPTFCDMRAGRILLAKNLVV